MTDAATSPVGTHQPSPVSDIYDRLRALNASWDVSIGRPTGSGWITGTELRDASIGPFNDLLLNIGTRAKTRDKRTIAASFALRFGWASGMAIAPFLKFGCVPDVALDNVSFKFRESTFLERTAMHEPRGVVIAGDPRAAHRTMRTVADREDLLRTLRSSLVTQATYVVEALYAWSGFARKGTWGMLTSSWAAQLTGLCDDHDDQRPILPQLRAFFAGSDVAAQMQPVLHEVTYLHATHLYQRRASCCRYYLLPQGDLCASCPLVSQDERMARNRAWMKTQLERHSTRQGHA